MKNIIFDWSGTLIDNQKTMFQAVRRVLIDYKKQLPYQIFLKDFKQPFKHFYSVYLPGISQSKIREKFIKYYLKGKTPNIIPGIYEQILLLRKNNHRIFIFSSHPKKILKKEFFNSSLNNNIEKYVGEVYDKKYALKKFIFNNKLDRKKTYYVGDMTSDIKAAKIAGIKSIAVTWGYNSKADLLKEKPDFILRKPKDLQKFLISK